MNQEKFPNPKELHNKHFPDERFAIGVRYRTSDGHDVESGNFVGGIPPHTEYLTVSLAQGGWNHETWDRLVEAYENEGFNVHLRSSSGTTRTRSGTCHHAPTSLYVW